MPKTDQLSPNQIRECIKSKYGSVAESADAHGFSRTVIYQSINGEGSRDARFAIARLNYRL